MSLAILRCRAQYGTEAPPVTIEVFLSGGLPPDSFRAEVPMQVLDEQIERWLELRHVSPALIIAPGDQLPPDGDIRRVSRIVQATASATF